MISATVAALTAELRAVGASSSQREIDPGDWGVIADAAPGTSYTMAQVANLEATHGVVGRTDRAEFGPGTKAQAVALALADALADVDADPVIRHRGVEWFVAASSGERRLIPQVQALEVAHGLVARTTRVEFR